MQPNKTIHRRALECLGAQKSNAVFIDDRPGFVNPARDSYELAVLIDRDDSYPNEVGEKI